jgi:clan AA aspartic protease (TIGR02281 family)
MVGLLRTGVLSAALFGTALSFSAVWAAPPHSDKDESAKADTPEAVARRKLSEKGLHVSRSGIALIDEKELTKAFAEANALKRKLIGAAKEQQGAEQQIDELQADMRQRLESSVEMNSQLANVRNNPVMHNQLVGAVNANNSEIKLLEQAEAQSKKDIDVVRKKANGARETYVQQIAEMRTLVDRLSERYKALKSDAEAQSALTEYNSVANANLEIKPSAYFVSSVKKLEQLEKTIVSEKIPLRREGNSYYANVVINGKPPEEMIVDTGATSVVLPYKVAVECGVKPEEASLTVIATIADGSKVKSKLVVLDSVRVGKFTAEHVECTVLPAEAKNAPTLLGMAFLSRFNFSINGTELVLSKIDGEHAAAKSKKAHATKPKNMRKVRKTEKTDNPNEPEG